MHWLLDLLWRPKKYEEQFRPMDYAFRCTTYSRNTPGSWYGLYARVSEVSLFDQRGCALILTNHP
jgi:hypothetical protein